jgi:hypothetical protein
MRRAARVRGAGLTIATVAAGWLERFETMARLSNDGCGPWRATGTTSTATYFLRWNDQIAPIAVYDIAGLIGPLAGAAGAPRTIAGALATLDRSCATQPARSRTTGRALPLRQTERQNPRTRKSRALSLVLRERASEGGLECFRQTKGSTRALHGTTARVSIAWIAAARARRGRPMSEAAR